MFLLVPVSSVSRSDDVSASVVDFFVIRKLFMEKPAGEESPRRREQNLTRERVCAGVIGWVPGLSQCGAAHNQDGGKSLSHASLTPGWKDLHQFGETLFRCSFMIQRFLII